MSLSLIIQAHVIYRVHSTAANGAVNRSIDIDTVRQMIYLSISELRFDLNDISIFFLESRNV